MLHGFGVSGNGSKEFFYNMEEVVVDSPIPIENEYLVKILAGYSQIDQGTPIFYSFISEKLIKRGIDLMTIE